MDNLTGKIIWSPNFKILIHENRTKLQLPAVLRKLNLILKIFLPQCSHVHFIFFHVLSSCSEQCDLMQCPTYCKVKMLCFCHYTRQVIKQAEDVIRWNDYYLLPTSSFIIILSLNAKFIIALGFYLSTVTVSRNFLCRKKSTTSSCTSKARN